MDNCRNLRSTVIRALGAENLVVVKLNFNGNDNWVYKLKNVKFEPSSKTLQTSQMKVYVDRSLFLTVKVNLCFMPDMTEDLTSYRGEFLWRVGKTLKLKV